MELELEKIKTLKQEELAAKAAVLDGLQLAELVEMLASKNDEARYGAFLLLLAFAEARADLYAYWDLFVEKLNSPNSYQRSIGAMMIARNARWDREGRINDCIQQYLALCDDEKPVTVRQCIQNIAYILPYHKNLCSAVADKLLLIDLSLRKETQRKLLYQDIAAILGQIQAAEPDSRIEAYLADNRKWLGKG